MRRLFLSLSTILCLSGNALFAQQQTPSSSQIQLANGASITLSPAAEQQATLSSTADPVQVWVRMTPGNRPPAQGNFQQALGGNDYLMILSGREKQLPAGAAWFAVMQPQWKMNAGLLGMPAGKAPAEVLVALASPAKEAFRPFLSTLHGRVLSEPVAGQAYFEVQLPADKLFQLAAWYGVLSVNPKANPQTLNHESKVVTRTENISAPVALGGYALQGEGMVIGVGDNASGLDHVDLRDRIINYNTWPFGSHGIHINGIVGGAGIMDPNARGFAPNATLIDHVYSIVWQRTADMVSSHGMSITNNSYAAIVGNCDYAGLYDGYSAMLDSITLAFPQVLHVFASGNDGGVTCPPYAKGFHTVVGAYQAAKNVLVVGNMHKNTNIEPGSSRGPVKDGRLKPEVCVVGTKVFSCKNDDTYQSAGGTSMASPQVAGLAALLSQRYKQLHGGALPPADLLKTVLMNGASDLGQPGPDFIYGFGAVHGIRSLRMLENETYFTVNLSEGGEASHTISVPAGVSKLKIMLYWHDAPASPVPVQKLVNDLDLEVTNGGSTYLPFVLDTNASALNQPALTGIDRLNNVEQVVVTAPAAGDWQVSVKGFSVPAGPQRYVLAYLFEEDALTVTYPFGGAAEQGNDSLRVAWEAPAGANTFTVEFSPDNGAAWTVLNNNVAAYLRNYAYRLPNNINSENCLVRVSRNGTGETVTTGPFIVQKPITMTLSPAAQQCPGSFTWSWNNLGTGITGYEILRKQGPELAPVDTVPAAQLSYTLTGLTPDSMYYVAIRPFVNGAPGKQSKGLRRKPLDGDCALPVFQGDLALAGILSPNSGRLFTSTALGDSEPLVVGIRNLTAAGIADYTVYYQVNGGAVAHTAFTGSAHLIAPGGYQEKILTTLDLSAPGAKQIKVWVTNDAAPDPIPANDTVSKEVRQLLNNALNLSMPLEEGFEGFAPVLIYHDTMGLSPDERWDYRNSSDSGRLRTYVDDSITISSSRSVSLDAYFNKSPGVSNLFSGTFNLSAYSGMAFELRAEFDYKLHGNPASMDSNRVWVRGSDTDPWVPLLVYDTTGGPGMVRSSGSLILNDVLNGAGQQFSTSTQLLFAQKDTSLIAANDYGNGLTLDNFRLYRVEKDLMVKRVAVPEQFSCGGNAEQPLSVVVYNTVNQPLNNVPVTYRLNGGAPVTEIIPHIAGKDSLTWTFAPLLDLSTPGVYTLDVYVAAAGDTYTGNDSLLHYDVRVQPVVDTFPYLQDFETDNGFWYTDGVASSWFWGAPNGAIINKAASGSKVWMSNTGGGYNSNEHSYLNAPCFDISGLANPMLSFSMTLELEQCEGSLCDYLQMEYSFDQGATWQRLGSAGEGTNWYNDDASHAWTRQENGRWHVSSIPLPQPPPGAALRLRFALHTDAGANLEGATIDDIHIFDLKYPIHEGPAGPISNTVAGDTLVQFVADGRLLAELDAGSQHLGTTSVQVYQHTDLIAPKQMQYLFPRSFVWHSAQQPASEVTLRLYVLDAEANTYFGATGCGPCTLPGDVYRLGATRYTDPDTSRENGTMADNESGAYTFYNSGVIRWVPYDKGYYASFRTNGFSEYWLNDSGLAPLPVILANLEAYNEGNRHRISWQSAMESGLDYYELEKSGDGASFVFLQKVPAQNEPYQYLTYDNDPLEGTTYYRLKLVFLDGTYLYSRVVRAFYKRSGAFELTAFPSPASNTLSVRVRGSGNAGDLILTDVSGRVVRRQHIAFGIGEMDVSSLSTGVYFLKYTDGKNARVLKVEKR